MHMWVEALYSTPGNKHPNPNWQSPLKDPENGRVVAFALAAFRQAFAGGHALDTDHVLIAASACEMHPRAVLKALESRRVREQLDEYTQRAGVVA